MLLVPTFCIRDVKGKLSWTPCFAGLTMSTISDTWYMASSTHWLTIDMPHNHIHHPEIHYQVSQSETTLQPFLCSTKMEAKLAGWNHVPWLSSKWCHNTGLYLDWSYHVPVRQSVFNASSSLAERVVGVPQETGSWPVGEWMPRLTLLAGPPYQKPHKTVDPLCWDQGQQNSSVGTFNTLLHPRDTDQLFTLKLWCNSRCVSMLRAFIGTKDVI